MIEADELVFVAAKDFQQLEVSCFFGGVKQAFLTEVDDLAQEFAHIKSQKLLIVFEDLVDEQSRLLVLVGVSHDAVEVFIELDLIGKVVPHVADEEAVAGRDQINVVLVVYRDAVHLLLDEIKCDRRDVEVVDQSLVLRVRSHRVNVEEDEVFS